MKNTLLVAACFGLGLAACGGSKSSEPERKDLGTAAGETAADTQALRVASGAVNEVIRNSTDCQAAKPAIVEARKTLDEVDRALKTATGRMTLDTLRKQVDRVADVCP